MIPAKTNMSKVAILGTYNIAKEYARPQMAALRAVPAKLPMPPITMTQNDSIKSECA
jgi:hypothetical protein